ncbi:MAG TPA: cytochrome C biogenesis protein, partial [Euryarchaeota archaeon]|nr:cytochrome C biogenesis protein [Euryarchaeota archaeon]
MDTKKELTEAEKTLRGRLVGLAFILFTVFLLGMFWLYTNPAMSVGLTLSYVAGLSMIVLPCTFPLVFVIVPLSMGHEYKKGFVMALLFSIGLIITLTLYGVVVAIAGRYIGVTRVQQLLYTVAGLAAFLFGLSELRLLKFSIPTYGGATPQIITRQGDYLKAFFLGLFLGNAGVACPNPATYVILTYIAASGSVVTGAALQFVNGLGRATPLIFLSLLGIVGVNATGWLVSKKETIDKLTG